VDNAVATTVPGDEILINAGTSPFQRVSACSADPKGFGGECHQNWLVSELGGNHVMAFAQDSFKPTRYLTIIPGVAAHTSSTSDDRGRQVLDINTWTPHLDVIWDPTHDGKTKLRASFHNNVDPGFLALARFAGRALYRQTCTWDDETKSYTRNCRSSGGDNGTTIGLPCGPEGVDINGNRCVGRLRAPRLWEYSVGAEREIFTGIAASVDFIYRKYAHQFEDVETNANWTDGGIGLRREANFKTSRSQFVFDLQTPDSASRRNVSATARIRKREGVLKALVAYTWMRYEGVEDADFATLYLDNPGQAHYYYGPLPGDIRHDVRAQIAWQARTWMSVGVNYLFASGGPYNRYHFDAIFGSYSRFQAQRGHDSRGTLSPDDDVPLRLPDITSLDLQVRFNLRPIIKQNLELWANVFNLLALRTTLSVIEEDGPFWGRTLGRMQPTYARLGVRYRF
jgi:hypothetical protein